MHNIMNCTSATNSASTQTNHHNQAPAALTRAAFRTCHIVVGTPGRLCALVSSGSLLLGRLAAVVLDEADQLLGDSFYGDTAWLMQQLPSKKQVGGWWGAGVCWRGMSV